MKLFSKGICRGFGAVYLPFKANGDKLIPLAVETECGNSIPYSSFWNSEYGTIVFVLSVKRLFFYLLTIRIRDLKFLPQ